MHFSVFLHVYICIFYGFLNFLWCFLCGKLTKSKLTKPCRHARTFQLVRQQNLASIIKKNPNILTKRPPVATAVPSGMNPVIGALVYCGIPSDLLSRPKQSHHLSGALLPCGYIQPIKSPMGVPIFNSTETMLKFTIYDQILRLPQSGVIFDQIYPFHCGVYLSGAIC